VHLRRLALCASLLAVPSVALAQKPSTERIRSAAEEFDAGRRSFNDGKYEEAAVHFENAFHDAPAPAAIRNALNSRKQAGHLARAAVLAALAQSKYPEDAATKELAGKVLAEVEPKLYKVALGCTPQCSVAADGRVISIEDATHIVFYLDPGDHEVTVGWSDDRTKDVKLRAKAGAMTELSLEAPPVKPKPLPTTGATTGGVTNTIDGGATAGGEEPSRKPFGPWLFVVGSVLTVGAGVATIISGVDTLNNPGADKVKAGCVGQGESCALYQQGLSAQTRTNVLIGVTAGVGVLTAVVGIFLTQWSSPKKPAAALGTWVRPEIAAGPTGASLGLTGAF